MVSATPTLGLTISAPVVCVLLAFAWGRCNTGRPGFGQCLTSADPYATETAVHPSSAGTCDFHRSGSQALCSYRQGCRDSDMGNWSVVNGVATVSQVSSQCGINTFSILQSPLLNFTTPSCVRFSFRRKNPIDLDVFLVDPTTTSASIVVNKNLGSHHHDTVLNRSFTVRDPMVRKIVFRAYGGGASRLQSLLLYHVVVQHVPCDKEVVVPDPPPTSPLPTSGPSASRSNTKSGPSLGTSTASHVSDTPSSVPETGTAPKNTISGNVSTATVPDTSTHRKHDGGNRREENAEDSAPDIVPIVGSVVAISVVILIIVIIAVIVVRRRRSREISRDDKIAAAKDMPAMNNASENMVFSEDVNSDHYSSIEDSLFLSSAPLRNHDSSDSENVQPYNILTSTDSSGFLANDGRPGKVLIGTSTDDTYNHTSSSEATKRAAPQLRRHCDDTYSHIGNPSAELESNVSTQCRRVVKTSEKRSDPRPDGINGAIHEKRKNLDVATGLAQPEGDYNSLNRNRIVKKPENNIIQNPYNTIGGQSYSECIPTPDHVLTETNSEKVTDDYNTLDFDQNMHNLPEFQERREISGEAYDHVSMIPDDTYNKTMIGKSTGVKFIDSDYDHVGLEGHTFNFS